MMRVILIDFALLYLQLYTHWRPNQSKDWRSFWWCSGTGSLIRNVRRAYCVYRMCSPQQRELTVSSISFHTVCLCASNAPINSETLSVVQLALFAVTWHFEICSFFRSLLDFYWRVICNWPGNCYCYFDLTVYAMPFLAYLLSGHYYS